MIYDKKGISIWNKGQFKQKQIPWNKGNHIYLGGGFKKGCIAWNKGRKMKVT